MDSAVWLFSAMTPWIPVLFIGVFFLIMTIYLFSSARPPVKRVHVVCPEAGKEYTVRMKINIFRNPFKIGKGLDVLSCPDFDGKEITCSKGCVFAERAQRIHRTMGERHNEKNGSMVLSSLKF